MGVADFRYSRNWRVREKLYIMGDTSPKNIQKLAEKKHDEHVKKEDHKHENAEMQHHHGQPENEQDEKEASKDTQLGA